MREQMTALEMDSGLRRGEWWGCEEAKGAVQWRNLVSGPNNTDALAVMFYGGLQMSAGDTSQQACWISILFLITFCESTISSNVKFN